jgi:hypothetical protein
MSSLLYKIIGVALSQCLMGNAFSAPVMYHFSTGANHFGTSPIAGLFSSNASVSGHFTYDAQSPFIQDVGNGLSYGGYSPSASPVASYNALLGSVSAITFSDTRGVAIVGNGRTIAGSGGPVDFFQLSADPSLTSASPHNISGFTIGNYTLVNVRLFWLEEQSTPEPIGDFLGNENLPAEPPTFHGRLSLDFIQTGTSPIAPAGFVFFDGLKVSPSTPVSEPAAYTVLLSGLGSLALCRRHRKTKSPTTFTVPLT